MSKNKKLNYVYLFILCFILFIIIVAEQIGLFYRLSLSSYDYFYQKKSQSSSKIVIVGIDDISLETLGRWPWKRSVVAKGIEHILSGNPSAIGIDVIYTEKSDDIKQDIALSNVISNKDNVVMASYFSFNETTLDGKFSIRSKHYPIDMLKVDSAFINVMPDTDGILRKFILYIDSNDNREEFFSYKIYKKACEHLGERFWDIDEIPSDTYNKVSIMYTGPPTNFTLDDSESFSDDSISSVEHIPFSYVYDGLIDSEYFRDKIVLIGATSIGVADDYYFTPIAKQTPMFGIEVHANIINQLMKGNFVKEISNLSLSLIIFFFGILTIIFSTKLKPKFAVISFVFLFVLLYMLSKIMLEYNMVFVPFYPAMSIIILYFSAMAGKYILTLSEKRNIENIFGKYIEKKVLNKLMNEDVHTLVLGGEKIEISVMFVDIRGFTSISEIIPAEEVVSILNEYLTLAADAIFATDGTLDKYIGDAAMAFWNAPLQQKHHQLRAIKTAIIMRDGTNALNEKLEARFGRSIYFGAGINTGFAIVGNIGSPFRMDYTVIGDTVNTAARIEGQSKGQQILITKDMYDIVKEYVDCIFYKSVFLKGKVNETHLYEVLNFKQGVDIDDIFK